MTQLWNHVKDWTRSIEIKYRSNEDDPGILTRVYFPFDPAVCTHNVSMHTSHYPLQEELTEEQKDIVKQNIARESPEDKAKDLLEWMEAIRRNVYYKVRYRVVVWLA